MRALPSVLVIAMTFPLAGCISLTASKPIPDWAMSSYAGNDAQPRARTVRRTAARQASTDAAVVMPTTTGNAGMATRTVIRPPAARPSDPTAYTPEWHAEEEAADDRLRRQMNICTRC